MPLIARAEHGAHYGLTGQREPTAEELAAARAACETRSTMCGDGETALAGAILALPDCAAILCARVGFTPWRALETAGIEPNSEHAEKTIEQALRALYDDWRASGRLMLAMTLSRATAG